MRRVLLGLFLVTESQGQVTKEVRYNSLSGTIQQPANFFATNIQAGSNTSIQVNSSGQITINATASSSGGSGTGDVTTAQILVVSNQVQVSSNYLSGLLIAVTNQFRSDITSISNITDALTNTFRTDIGNLQGATNSFNTTNANLASHINNIATNTIRYLTNLWGDVARGFGGLANGQVLKYNSTSGTWTNDTDATGGGGGSSLTTNANQFGPSVELTIKSGVVLTNPTVYEGLTLSNSAITIPPTNHIRLGKDSYAGRGFLEWWDEQGLSIAVQPALMNNRVVMFYPSATTVIGSYGLTIPVNLGGVTVSHPPPTEGWPYAVQLATPATSNACAGTFSSIDMTTEGTRYGYNGYFFGTEFLSTNLLVQHTKTAPAGNRLFIGRTSTANPGLTNIVNTTNGTGQYAGLYTDSGYTNEFFLSVRDGTAEFRTNTGMLFVATNLYQFYMMQAPTSKFLGWKLRNMTSNTTAQGWFSNNVPTNMMKFGYLIRNGTTVVNSVRFTKIYVEAPLSP